MDLILLGSAGAIVSAMIWVVYVLMHVIINGCLAGATGFAGVYVGSCVQSDVLFNIGDVGMTSSGIIAFLLMVAMFKFGARLFTEIKIAAPRILHPFSSASS